MEETNAVMELREDKSRFILTAEKGVAMVMLGKQDYLNKAKDLLADKGTYRLITGDPTMRLRNKLIQILRTIKAQGGLGDTLIKDFIPLVKYPHFMSP